MLLMIRIPKDGAGVSTPPDVTPTLVLTARTKGTLPTVIRTVGDAP